MRARLSISRAEFKALTKENERGCWIWQRPPNGRGYGMLKINGRQWRAHRVSWTLYKRRPLGDLLVCHRCDTPLCVNPKHLFLGTTKQNAEDMMRKGRWAGGRPAGTLETSEMRARKSAAHLGKKLSAMHCAAIAEAQRASWARRKQNVSST